MIGAITVDGSLIASQTMAFPRPFPLRFHLPMRSFSTPLTGVSLPFPKAELRKLLKMREDYGSARLQKLLQM